MPSLVIKMLLEGSLQMVEDRNVKRLQEVQRIGGQKNDIYLI
jgi:hypothetical protein